MKLKNVHKQGILLNKLMEIVKFSLKYMLSNQKTNTDILDQVLAKKRLQSEQERQFLLQQVLQWLDKFAESYGIEQAYIFGSLTKPGKFHQKSDIDIAVEQINPENFCNAISFLSTETLRDVDIIKLSQCHFADSIRNTGILWTKMRSQF